MFVFGARMGVEIGVGGKSWSEYFTTETLVQISLAIVIIVLIRKQQKKKNKK